MLLRARVVIYFLGVETPYDTSKNQMESKKFLIPETFSNWKAFYITI
jgi:hypothetical protein